MVRNFSYNTRQWRRASIEYRTANPVCVECARIGQTTLAECVDHIVPIAEGADPWDRENFQALCNSCHSRKTHSRTGYRNGADINGNPLDPEHPWNSA